MTAVQASAHAAVAYTVPLLVWVLASAAVSSPAVSLAELAPPMTRAIVLVQFLGLVGMIPLLPGAPWSQRGTALSLLVLAPWPLLAMLWASGGVSAVLLLRAQAAVFLGAAALSSTVHLGRRIPRAAASVLTAVLQVVIASGLWAWRATWLETLGL